MKKITIKQSAIGAALLIAGIVLGWLLFGGSSQTVDHRDHSHESLAEVWTCSMHPQVRADGPGKCPFCGMDLIPVAAGDDQEVGIDQVQMTEAAIKMAAVQTVTVGNSVPQKVLYLPGKIEADERNIAKVTTHFNGRVERLFADFTGQYIKRGQPLATLYSPDLVTAQKELFEALKFKSTNPSFYEAAIQKLKLWELTDRQIQGIISNGQPQYNFNIYAPRSGTIMSREITEGEHVMEGQVLFEIADLNKLWVLFDAYENDLPWINVGDSISFKTQSVPGRTFKSIVTFIDPVVDKQTRTTSIRTELILKDDLLKPEMFVEGVIRAAFKDSNKSMLIPKTAVLWTGKRAVVYVRQPQYEKPTFQFREIELGADVGDYYVVNEGLSIGEEIVANGVFKIDGAAQLQGKVSMMNPSGAKMGASHQHGAFPMEEGSEPHQSAGEFDVSKTFKDQLRDIFKAYLPLKESLVQTDAQSAREQAQQLLKAINKVDMTLVKGEAHHEWMKDLSALRKSVRSIIDQTEVQQMRQQLSALSDQLYFTLTRFQVESGGYRLYCPMAFDSSGAYWLSDSREVLNPYFGEDMLNCGSVTEEL